MAGMPKQTPLPFPDAQPARPDPTGPSSATPSGPAQAEGDAPAVAAESVPEVVEPAARIEATGSQPDPAQTELPMPGAVAPRPGPDIRQYPSRRPWWARLLGSIMAPWV